MKRIVIVILPFLLVINAYGQVTLPLTQGFEGATFPPSGWTQAFISGSRAWTVNQGGFKPPGISYGSPPFAYEGDYNAFFQTNTVGHTTKLITPPLDMRTVAKPIVQFYEARVKRLQADELRVYFRISPQDDWHLLEEYLDESAVWTPRQIVLPFKNETELDDTLRTNTFQIAFEATSRSGYGVCVDNVNVYESAVFPLEVDNVSARTTKISIASGTTLNPIGYAIINVKGNDGTLSLNSLTVEYIGSRVDDIVSMRLYSTSDSTFRKNNQINATLSKSGNSFIFTDISHNLSAGDNLVWITADIDINADHNSELSFSIPANSISIGSHTYPSLQLNPGGKSYIQKSIKVYDFDEENGWELDPTGHWQIGYNTGSGRQDPEGPYDGAAALATNLDGNYPTGITEPIHAISDNINAKYFQNIQVYYRRWLNTNYQHNMLVSISPDNKVSWNTLWQNFGAAIQDNNWMRSSHNTFLSRRENISLRFTLGTNITSLAYGGWNVDNLAITGEFIHSDVGVKSLISPIQSCGLTNQEEIKVIVRNYGGATVSKTFDVGYSLNGGTTWVREEFSSPIKSEADGEGDFEMEFTFATKADFSTPGLKNLRFRTFLEGDQDVNNDVHSKSLYAFPTYVYPYQSSFESNNGFWYPSGTNSTWQWGTPSGAFIKNASNGNRAWATSLSGNYKSNEKSYLESPCYDLSTAVMPIIAFDYMMQTEPGVDGLTLEYSVDGGTTWTSLTAHNDYAYNWFDTPTISSLNAPGWSANKAQYVTAKNMLPSDAIGVNGVKFRFVFGSNATTQYEGVAIDMVRIYELPFDVGITELVSPIDACEIGYNVPLDLKLKNYGFRTIPQNTEIPIVVQVDGGALKMETITTPSQLAQNDEYTFTTTNTFNLFSAGVHEIVAYTNLEVDDNNANNSHETSVEVLGMPEFTLGPDIGVEDFTNPIIIDAGTGYDSYSWYKLPDESSTIGTSNSIEVSEFGDYKVAITKVIDPELTCYAEDDVRVMVAEKDIGVINITNIANECERLAPINPTIIIKSFRYSTFTEGEVIPLVVEVDNQIVLNEDFTPELGWGGLDDEVEYTFTGAIDISEEKTYNISIYTNLEKDLDRENDSYDKEVTTFGYPEVNILVKTNDSPLTFEEFSEIATTAADTLTFKVEEGFSSYTWEMQTFGQSEWATTGADANTYTPAVNNSSTYRVTVNDSNGCGDAQHSVFVNAFDIAITSINNPTAEFCDGGEEIPLSITLKNVGNDEFPAGTVIELSALTPMGDQNTVLTLSNPLAINEETTYVFPQNKLFPIGETYINFVANTALDLSDSNNEQGMVVTVNPSPSVSIEPDVLYKIFSTSESYEIKPTYSEDILSYLWHDGLDEANYTIWGVPNDEVYSVTVENEYGCTAYDEMRVVTSDLSISTITFPRTGCELRDNADVTFTLVNNGNTTYTSGTDINVNLFLNGAFVTTETINLTEDFISKTSKQITLDQKLNLGGMNSATVQLVVSSAAEEVDNENNSRNKSVYALGYPSPNLGADRDIYGWGLELDPGYYDTYVWHDNTSDRIYNAEETGTYSVTVTDFSGCPGSAEVVLTFYKDDIELLEVLEPETGCGLSNAEPVTFKLRNNGNYPIPEGREIQVGFIQNFTNYSAIHTVEEPIGVDEEVEITLPITIDLSLLTTRTINFWVDMENDGFENNTLSKSITTFKEVSFNFNHAPGKISNVPLELSAVRNDGDAEYISYQWQFNGVNVSTDETFIADETGIYGLTVEDTNGCEGYREANYTILMPDYTISELISPTNTCVFGNNHEVTVEVTNVGTDVLDDDEEIDIELWLNGTLITTETFEMESDLEPGQSIVITLDYKLNLGSASEHSIGVKVIAPIDRNPSNDMLTETVIAYGNPQVNLGGDRAINTGSVVLDAGAGYQSYEWQDGSTNQTFTVTETGTYSVTVIDDNGCIGSDAVTITVLVPDYAVTGIIAPAAGCDLTSTETITLEITNVGTDILRIGDKVPVTFEVDNQVVATEEHTVTQRIEPSNKGQFTLSTKANLSQVKTYGLKATVSYALDNNTSNNSYSAAVEHYPSPTVDLGGDQEVTLPYTIESGISDVDYLWSTGATTPSITVDNPGEYWLTVTNSYGCEASDTITLTISSVQVIPGSNTVVTVFPNPADQWITVRVEPQTPAKYVIELISPSGQRVYSYSTEQAQQFDHRIDVNNFASGVYILRVSSGGGWITVRLVIQR